MLLFRKFQIFFLIYQDYIKRSCIIIRSFKIIIIKIKITNQIIEPKVNLNVHNFGMFWNAPTHEH